MNAYKLTSVLALAALPFAASAATQPFSDSITVTETQTLTGVNQLSLSQFDSDLGTLTGVTLTISLTADSFDLGIDNDQGETSNVTVSFGTLGAVLFGIDASTFDGVSSTVTGADFNVTTQSSTFDVAANDLDATDQYHDDAGPDNGGFTTTAVDVGVADWSVDASQFSAWQAATPGDVTLDLAVDFTTDIDINSGGADGDFIQFQGSIPTATFSADVTYEYTPTTPVPESSSYALLAGVAAFGWIMVRRRK